MKAGVIPGDKVNKGKPDGKQIFLTSEVPIDVLYK